jgi:diguanylate cyclase (GGDEF)-like protein
MNDLTEEERLRAEAMRARIDHLTGLMNRRGFFENARLLFSLAARQAKPVTFAYIDVDNLKNLNDMFGHSVGDQALKGVGTMLTSAVRSSDVVGRLGGDEFAIVLLGINASDANELFDRLHKQLSEMMRARGWESGVSIGVVTFANSIPDIQEVIKYIQEVIKYADALMYKAKKNGKGRVIYEELASTG